jgi:hypothetical protein
VYYGAASGYVLKYVDGSSGRIQCDNATFGRDPAAGVVKACYVVATYSAVCSEDESCPADAQALSGHRLYGAESFSLPSDLPARSRARMASWAIRIRGWRSCVTRYARRWIRAEWKALRRGFGIRKFAGSAAEARGQKFDATPTDNHRWW